MAEGVSSEAVISGGEMSAFERGSGEDRLPKVSVRIEESDKPFDLNVIELAGEVSEVIVPADKAFVDHVETCFHLFGNEVAGYVVLYVEEVGGGAAASIERGDGSAQGLQFGRITDARVASGAGEIETGGGNHRQSRSSADSRGWLGG